MRRMSPSPDQLESKRWLTGVALAGLLGLVGASGAWAGRITILGEGRDHATKGPIEVTVDGDRVNLSIGGDSIALGEDSTRGGPNLRRIYRHRVGGRDGDVVSIGHDVVVRADEVVHGGAVSIGGSVRVDGRVEGDAVSIGGGIQLGPDAAVQGDAVSIWGRGIELGPGSVITGEAVTLGGRIEESPGSRVGQRTQIGFMPAFHGGKPFFLVGAWILFLVHLVFVGLVGWAIVKIFARRWSAAVANLRARAGESLLAGIGAGILYGIAGVPLLLVIMLVMVAIVVGIPLVPLILLLMLICPIPGYATTAILLGQSVRGGTPSLDPLLSPNRHGGEYLIGHLLLSAPAFLAVLLRSAIGSWMGFAGIFLLVAWGALSLASAFGWGALLLSRLGKRYPHGMPGAPVPPAVPPAPVS